MISKKTVVVGAGRGVGRFLCERWQAHPFVRGDAITQILEADTIVFCAASARFETGMSNHFAMLEDNLLLLDRITRIPTKRFIYFSSCDVYPKDGLCHDEQEDLKLENISGGYPSLKLMSEALVRERYKNHIILRPTSLFGPDMRLNNIARLIWERPVQLSLSAKAQFNCVTYEMIARLIEAAVHVEETGTFNCAASGAVSLGEIGDYWGFKGLYGRHHYQAPNMANGRAIALVDEFSRHSFDVLQGFFGPPVP